MSIDGAGLAWGAGLFATGALTTGGLVWCSVRKCLNADQTLSALTGMAVSVLLMGTGTIMVEASLLPRLPSMRMPAPQVQLISAPGTKK